MQFSAVVSRFIVKAELNSISTNDLKRKYYFSENVHNCRLSHFKFDVAKSGWSILYIEGLQVIIS